MPLFSHTLNNKKKNSLFSLFLADMQSTIAKTFRPAALGSRRVAVVAPRVAKRAVVVRAESKDQVRPTGF